jgi:hypothetical protein
MFSVVFAMFVMLTPALAQTGAIRVSVPFAFTVGKQDLPPGDYRVAVSGPSLQVTRIDAFGVSSVLTNFTGGGPNENQSPRLVFRCYGSRRFLTQAWMGETDIGHEISTTSAELEFARNAPSDRTVIVAAR